MISPGINRSIFSRSIASISFCWFGKRWAARAALRTIVPGLPVKRTAFSPSFSLNERLSGVGGDVQRLVEVGQPPQFGKQPVKNPVGDVGVDPVVVAEEDDAVRIE